MRRYAFAGAAAILSLGLVACGGGDDSGSSGGTTPPPTTPTTPAVNNVQPVVVDSGPTFEGQPIGANDELFTTVTICVPGTTTCQSIDHVLVDTGSTGLRLLSSEITLTLPYLTDSTNSPIGNCIQYADTSFQWGPMVKVDIQMAGEVASSVPIQVAGAGSNFAAAPTSCSAGGIPNQTVLELGANGILGVGLFRQDCGPACASSSPPAGAYYSCPPPGCTPTSVALTSQLQNPVWMFPQDNNGLAIILPQVGATGATSVSGSMIFGIGTQSNNGLGSAQAQAANDLGNFTTTFNGMPYTTSYIDSGSNGFFFADSNATGLPLCSNASVGPDFYCPASPVSFTALTSAPNPSGSGTTVSANIAFSIGNAANLIDSPNTAFNNLGGPNNPGTFDWGLPFFFGRVVFIGIEGQKSAAGTGPYWAY
jgi:Protein of unknown function (DUF3443)